MRITGGLYKNRKIECPSGIIRPAMDRMRESVFSILGDLSSHSFLDLFSGSGVVGIEAASRGASPVILIEMDFKKKKTMNKNISFIQSEIKIIIIPVMQFLRVNKKKYDYIFLDPPFNLKDKQSAINLIEKKKTLSPNGSLIIHIPKEEKLPKEINSLKQCDIRIYGRSTLVFFTISS